MKYLLLFMILIISLLVGCSAEAIESEPVQLQTVSSTMAVKEFVEKTYISIGEVVPNNQIDLYTSGLIENIYVNPGDQVAAGDVLLSLNNDNVTSTFNSSESQLRTIRDNTKSQYDLAKVDLVNQEALFGAGVISTSQFNQTKNTVDNLYRQYTDAVVNYNNQIKNLKDNVGDKAVSSPIDGMIAAVYYNEGQTVNNQMSITIVDNSIVYIKTFVSSDMKRQLTLGDQVTLYVDGSRDEKHLGQISEINEIPDQQSKLFEVHIEATDSYDYIIGEYAEVEYIIEKYQAYLVPTSSIVRSQSEEYIYTLEDNQVKKIQIQTGQTKGEWIEVKSLNDTLQVIVQGQFDVVDGETVKEID